MLTQREAEVLLAAVRTQYRHLTRLREDAQRAGIISIDLIDSVYEQQGELYKILEKLENMAYDNEK